MSDLKRIVVLSVLVMAGCMFIATATTTTILYITTMENEREQLMEIAKGQAHFMESVARFDAIHSQEDHPDGARAATISQIVAAHENYPGFGETGELVVAQREGDQIVFLFAHRYCDGGESDPVPWRSELAEPMRRALSGQEGTLVGFDYRGERVLAAYHPVGILNLGVVVKSDLAEIRAPFVMAALIAGGVTAVLVLGGTGVTLRVTGPLVRQLQESKDRITLLLDSTAEAIYGVDLQGNCTFSNASCLRILGYREESDLLGKDMHDLIHHTRPDGTPYPSESCRIYEGFRRGQGTHVDDEVLWKADGASFPAEYWSHPVHRNGQIVGAVVTFLDITERKRASEESHAAHEKTQRMNAELTQRAQALQAARRASLNLIEDLEGARSAADAANHAKSEFLANMSHEIRTPMTAILGFTDLLGEGCQRKCDFGNNQLQTQVDTIRRNGEYLLGLINDILDLSKIEAGKMAVERRDCQPCRIIAEVASLMRVRADTKGLPFNIEYIGAIPETIQSDPTRLRQILINLIGNAIKFTEVGAVRLVTRFVDRCDAPCLQFDVIDTGRGLTEEQVAKLFQPFMQADNSATREFGGTGLGLTISKRFARLLGGDITIVETEVGVGSTFRACVGTGPLDSVAMLDDPMSATVVADSATTIAQVAPPDLHGLRILLAEDGPDNQRLISFVLKKAGADVTVEENGKLALDAALAARDEGPGAPGFDVILMDMQMPVMDGYEATGQLRQKGYSGPIIALTAHAMEGDRDKCIKAGCDDYATKPIDRKKLIEIIQQHLLPAEAASPMAT